MNNPSRLSSALWWSAFLVWAATSLGLVASTLDDEMDVVPMLLTDVILWPNTMTLGAFAAASALIAFNPTPSSRAFVFVTLGGSAFGLASLWVTTEVEFLLCAISTLALAVMAVRCILSRRPPLAVQTMALAIYVLYGVSVYAGHTMFLFPFFDEINAQRAEAAAAIVAGDDPLSDPACRSSNFACFPFAAEGDRRGFPEFQWSYIVDVDRNRPVEPVSLELSIEDGLNHKADLAFVGMRHVAGSTAVVVSLPGHLAEWRVLVAKYFIASSSYTFLFLYVTLLPAGLWLQRRRRPSISGS